MSMLTTVPFDDFMTMDSEALEESLSHKFDFDDFLKASKSFDDLVEYVNGSGLKLLGEGSARAVYMLPSKQAKSFQAEGPCVLKIAIDPAKGPAQNKAESWATNKYQNRYECFPKLYAYDSDNWYYVATEIGTPLDGAPKSFLYPQLKRLHEYFQAYIQKHNLPQDVKVLDPAHFVIKQPYMFVDLMDAVLTVFSWPNVASQAELSWVNKLLRHMTANGDELIKGIADTMRYFKRYRDSEINCGDFGNEANWAFVKRNGKILLIPIDWGGSSEVMDTYYSDEVTESTKFTLTIKQLRQLVREASLIDEAPQPSPITRMEDDIMRLEPCTLQKALCWKLDGYVFVHKKLNPSFSKRMPYMILCYQSSSGWQMHFENFTQIDAKPYLDAFYKAFAKTCEEKGIKEIFAVGGCTPGGLSGISSLQRYGFKKEWIGPFKTKKEYQRKGNIYWGGELDVKRTEAWLNKGTHLDEFLYIQDGMVMDPKEAPEGTEFNCGNTMPKPFKMVR